MPFPFWRYSDSLRLSFLLLLLIAARLLFLLWMPDVHSRDLDSWLRVADLLSHGGNPYRETAVLNWPPFWMQAIFGASGIAARTGISTLHVLEGMLMAGECICCIGAYWMLKCSLGVANPFRLLLFGLVLNPVSFFLTCQHGNYDVFVGFWVLLAAAALLRNATQPAPQYWLAAAFFVGIGVATKTIPVILTPLLFVCAKGQARATKMLGGLLLLTPVIIGMSVIYTLAPEGVRQNVIGYRSLSGWYGISGLLGLAGLSEWNKGVQRVMPLFFLGGMVALYFGFRRMLPGKVQTLRLMLLSLIAIPTFGPGYSPPYVLWFLPLLVVYFAVASQGERRLLLTLYGVAALTYCVEYALFESHGAFIKTAFSSPEMTARSDYWGSQPGQTIIRLPMFGLYVAFWVRLLQEALRERRE